ncbi:MAG: Intracellular protease 1 [Candidatus Methanofastidiosum methylothiophilum]|uniref:Intracellular protease 1 n=1 Tax=Candidatus Methanofastidiosum methylothiophilum TaxID=1705564 RepID=A0A150IYX9_9EURY|nr:MAG: Intracellular protease 1 [Candidatus Methanofastidiosum methylthiophilus]KYC47907.1 MAG: Intracellular protease 1 [Candidatus Methanofastidiosum methylthiophilus]KYC50068.1 MAG: Intracellular protease 1 [Candidatus Methanofastidiosum methylthiophilus]
MSSMRIAFIIYNKLTTLDFIGAYDPLTRIKTMGFSNQIEYDVCSFTDRVVSVEGLEIVPTKIRNDLSSYDYVIIPGGKGVFELMENKEFLEWLRIIPESTLICTVCYASLLLGVIGKLKGKKATTHRAVMEDLKKYTDNALDCRIVEDGNIITARGVSRQ